MSLHFILDGYNILMRLPEMLEGIPSVHFDTNREGLIHFLIQYRPQGSPNNCVSVVFDGFAEMKMNWNRLRQEKIEVIFSEEKSADDWIACRVDKTKHSKGMVVVTDDRELSLRIQRLKVKVIPVDQFVSKVVAQHQRNLPARDEAKKGLSKDQERRITEELKKIWLR